MNTNTMLMYLRNWQTVAEQINDDLKREHVPNEDHRWDNLWIAYVTSGKLITDIIMLQNLLRCVQAEGRE